MDNLETRTTPHEDVVIVYFGPAWNSRMTRRSRRVPTPLGEECFLCEEPIAENDRGLIKAVARLDRDGQPYGALKPVHVECETFPLIGHAVGVCTCNGHALDRDAAKLAWQRARLDGMHF